MNLDCAVSGNCRAGEIVVRVNEAVAAVGTDMSNPLRPTKIVEETALTPLVLHLGLPVHDVEHLISDLVSSLQAVVDAQGFIDTDLLRGYTGQVLMAGAFSRDPRP